MTGRQKENRTEALRVRVSPVELAQIRRGVGDGYLSEHIRSALLGHTPRLPRRIPEINQKAWQAHARTLANLNQIARAINQGLFSDEHIADEILSAVESTDVSVRGLRAQLIGIDHIPHLQNPIPTTSKQENYDVKSET